MARARTRMVTVLSDVDCAWLAAAIDGEGSLRLDRPRHMRPDYFYPRLHVANTSREFLDHAHEITSIGRIYEMSQPKEQPDRRPVFAWVACGQVCVDLLHQIFPYLIIKRAKAEEILASTFSQEIERVMNHR